MKSLHKRIYPGVQKPLNRYTEWVIAICTNCHKEAHYSGEADQIKNQHREKVLQIEQRLALDN